MRKPRRVFLFGVSESRGGEDGSRSDRWGCSARVEATPPHVHVIVFDQPRCVHARMRGVHVNATLILACSPCPPALLPLATAPTTLPSSAFRRLSTTHCRRLHLSFDASRHGGASVVGRRRAAPAQVDRKVGHHRRAVRRAEGCGPASIPWAGGRGIAVEGRGRQPTQGRRGDVQAAAPRRRVRTVLGGGARKGCCALPGGADPPPRRAGRALPRVEVGRLGWRPAGGRSRRRARLAGTARPPRVSTGRPPPATGAAGLEGAGGGGTAAPWSAVADRARPLDAAGRAAKPRRRRWADHRHSAVRRAGSLFPRGGPQLEFLSGGALDVAGRAAKVRRRRWADHRPRVGGAAAARRVVDPFARLEEASHGGRRVGRVVSRSTGRAGATGKCGSAGRRGGGAVVRRRRAHQQRREGPGGIDGRARPWRVTGSGVRGMRDVRCDWAGIPTLRSPCSTRPFHLLTVVLQLAQLRPQDPHLLA
eukprot:scaffold9396_cov100-Isochrysis_galbana.AAC.1